MSIAEEKRAALEIMRLILAVKIRFQSGIDRYIAFDDAGDNVQANQELLDEAEFVVRARNRIANAVKHPIAGAGIIAALVDQGYSIAGLKAEFNPIYNAAQLVVNNTPVTRTQVDNQAPIILPELVSNESTNTLP